MMRAVLPLLALLSICSTSYGQIYLTVARSGNLSGYGNGYVVKSCEHASVLFIPYHQISRGGSPFVRVDQEWVPAKIWVKFPDYDIASVIVSRQLPAMRLGSGPAVEVRGWWNGQFWLVPVVELSRDRWWYVSGSRRIVYRTCLWRFGRVPLGLSGAPFLDRSGGVVGSLSLADANSAGAAYWPQSFRSWISGIT